MVCLALPVWLWEIRLEEKRRSSLIGVYIHRSQAAVLPADPGLCAGVVIIVYREGEAVLCVIAAGEIPEDGVALEHCQSAVIVVDDGGDTAIGVHGDEPGLLLDIQADVDVLGSVLQAIGVLELLEQDGRLEAVGGGAGEQLDALRCNEACWSRHDDDEFHYGLVNSGTPSIGRIVCVVGYGRHSRSRAIPVVNK